MSFARCLALSLVLVALPVHAASAQREPSASETALARQEFDAGMRSARDTQWEAAREHFARSYALAPRPVTLLNLAGAQAQTGQLVAASESYRRFIATASERDLGRYRAQVEQALSAADAQIGHAQLRLEGLADGDEVRLDDQPIARASLSLALPLDPGDHVVAVVRQGTEVARSAFGVTDGQTSTVRVTVARSIPSAADAVRADNERTSDDTALRVGEPRGEVDDGGIFASPWFWIVAGAVVAIAVVTTVVLVSSGGTEDPFQGTLMPGSITVD